MGQSEFAPAFDHAVMNLPATAVEFLDAFAGAFDPGMWAARALPLVHVYAFLKSDESTDGEAAPASPAPAPAALKESPFLRRRVGRAPSPQRGGLRCLAVLWARPSEPAALRCSLPFPVVRRPASTGGDGAGRAAGGAAAIPQRAQRGPQQADVLRQLQDAAGRGLCRAGRRGGRRCQAAEDELAGPCCLPRLFDVNHQGSARAAA